MLTGLDIGEDGAGVRGEAGEGKDGNPPLEPPKARGPADARFQPRTQGRGLTYRPRGDKCTLL